MRGIPQYALYGEPPQAESQDFLHLEILEDRSRPSGWTIRPHRHGDLHQIFLITLGAGRISIDGAETLLDAPFLVLAPAGSVHGFTWPPGSAGYVLTVSDSLLRAAISGRQDLAALFSQSLSLQLAAGSEEAAGLAQALARFLAECTGFDDFRDAAVRARLLLLLIDIARLETNLGHAQRQGSAPEARLAARFRDLLERRFRTADTVADLARALAVSEKQLRAACRKAAGMPPARQLRTRRLLEAKRLLTYSVMSVAEIAYALGFEEPAYFSHFFAGLTGQSPAAFRALHRRLALPGESARPDLPAPR